MDDTKDRALGDSSRTENTLRTLDELIGHYKVKQIEWETRNGDDEQYPFGFMQILNALRDSRRLVQEHGVEQPPLVRRAISRETN